MNIYTREIAELLEITLDLALKVQTHMGYAGLDFSECTQAEFESAAKEVWRMHQCDFLLSGGYNDIA